VSSGVETGGVKDPVKMREFVESVREADMSEAKR
jgi:phosphoribosylanthranilate isomerase